MKQVASPLKGTFLILTLLAIILVTGCVKTIYMDDSKLFTKRKALILFKVVTYNEVNSSFELSVPGISITDMQTQLITRFDLSNDEPDISPMGYRSYWFGLYLPPGKYKIDKVLICPNPNPLQQLFHIRPFFEFTLEKPAVYYGGSLQITNKQLPPGSNSTLGKFFTGGLMGYVNGINEGALVSVVSDNYAQDTREFIARFHVLANTEIINLTKQD